MDINKLIEFSAVNTNYSCVLLGRNFMKLHGNVMFDFINGKVKLGNDWVNGIKINKKQPLRVNKKHPLRVNKKTVIPSRIALKCNNGDFESNIFGIIGVHIVQARVSPSINGVFTLRS